MHISSQQMKGLMVVSNDDCGGGGICLERCINLFKNISPLFLILVPF